MKKYSLPLKKEQLILTPQQAREREEERERKLAQAFEPEKKPGLSNDFNEIINHLGDDLPRPDSYHFLLKIFTKEEKTNGGILLTDDLRENQNRVCMVGLILAMGPDCYNSERFKNWNKRSVGDWVLFVPGEGTLFQCKGIPLRFVADDRIFCKTNSPELITRT
jgi:co-chaperonin GroES (HSP10)